MKNFSVLLVVLYSCACLMSSCEHGENLPDIGQGFEVDSLSDPWDGLSINTRFCSHIHGDRFYFNFEAADSTMTLTNVTQENDLEVEDRVEIYFSPEKDMKKSYYCVEMDPHANVLDYKADYYRKLDFQWNFSTLQVQSDVTPWGYRVSGSIALCELESFGINLEKGFWLGVFQADYHPDGSVNWFTLVPTDSKEADFHTPDNLMKCKATQMKERRGVVLYPNDITSLGVNEWAHRIDVAGINLIGLHAATFNDPIDSLKNFVQSELGQQFLRMCEGKGVDVEYEVHALQYLLPRDMFTVHPEYFPADSNGVRQQAYNICFTSEEVLEAMRPRLEALLEWMKPTTHRYFFWPDDAQIPCLCENCRKYTASEQNLLYENRFLEMLREYDKEATLAHLAYAKALDAPRKVRANSGIFLEYAPIGRDYKSSLSPNEAAAYKANLLAFPAYSQHILEYWLDESMFSQWKPNELVPLPDNSVQCAEDITFYRGNGACSITTFATWLNGRYVEKYGSADSIFVKYGQSFSRQNMK